MRRIVGAHPHFLAVLFERRLLRNHPIAPIVPERGNGLRYRMACVVTANALRLALLRAGGSLGRNKVVPIMPERRDRTNFRMIVTRAAHALFDSARRARRRFRHHPFAEIVTRSLQCANVGMRSVAQASPHRIAVRITRRLHHGAPLAPIVSERGNRCEILVFAGVAGALLHSRDQTRGRGSLFPFRPIVPVRGKRARFDYGRVGKRDAGLQPRFLASGFQRRRPFAEQRFFPLKIAPRKRGSRQPERHARADEYYFRIPFFHSRLPFSYYFLNLLYHPPPRLSITLFIF